MQRQPQKMKFGLNVASKKKAQPKPAISRAQAFGQEDDSDEEQPNQNQKGNKKAHMSNVNRQIAQGSRMNKKQAEEHAKALEEDANIFDYDAVYDDLKEVERKKKEALKGADTKKAKYIHNLLEMAEIRKKDRLLAEEKKVAREREAEGDAYADKETFETETYKKQKAELERIEQEERQREEETQKKKKMQSFYKQLLDKKASDHAELMAQLEAQKSLSQEEKEARRRQEKEQADLELAKKAEQEGKDVMLNDNNEIVDRRQLLGAGLNVRPKFGSLGSLADKGARERQKEYDEYKRKKVEEYEAKRRGGLDKDERERYSREIEQQMVETREREKKAEEEKQRALEQKAAVKRTTDEAAMSARERFLARKKAKLEKKPEKEEDE